MFYFTPLPGFFSPFPRGTGSLSVTQEYLALRDGSRGFTRGFYRATRDAASIVKLSTTRLSLPLVWLSTTSSSRSIPCRCPTTPTGIPTGLGSSRFARRYWGNHVCFLFLQLLRCFSSLRSLFLPYGFR
jgi:hypothetical protein